MPRPKTIAPTGVTTSYDYYSEAGEDTACPPDPHGFLQWLKTQTVTPASTASSEPTRSTRYTYQSLPVLGESDKSFIVRKDEISYDGAQQVRVVQATYFSDQNPLHQGRLKTRHTTWGEQTQPDIQEEFAYATLEREQDTGKHTVLTKTVTVTGWQAHQLKHYTERSQFLGSLLKQQDQYGVEISSSYDSLGRLVQEIKSPSTPHEAQRSYTYGWYSDSDSDTKYPELTMTDANGVQTRQRFDGLGRMCEEAMQDVDMTPTGQTPPWRVIQRNHYDALGRISKHELIDHLRVKGQDPQAQIKTQTFTYDDWDVLCQVAHSDGRVEVSEQDPITRISRAGFKGLGMTETTLNNWYRPTQVRLLMPDGKTELSKVRFKCDSLGREVEAIDEQGHTTQSHYDTWDRVITQRLADDTRIEIQYTEHGPEALPIQLQVTYELPQAKMQQWILGQQQFDDLNRLVQSKVGGRTTQYHYAANSPVPETVTTPSQAQLQSCHEPQLDYALTAIESSDTEKCQFQYDVKTGALLKAVPPERSQGRPGQKIWTYYPSGLLKTEQHEGFQGQTRQTDYYCSLLGKLQTVQDSNSTQQYQYDQHGRLTQWQERDYIITITYDSWSRLSQIQATHQRSKTTTTREMHFDEWSRLVHQTYKLDGQTLWSIQQSYHQNNQLAVRITQKGDDTVLRKETSHYDKRNRLIQYTCEGIHPPKDPSGRLIQCQTWTYGALNQIQAVDLTFQDQTKNKLTYSYENTKDPTQVTRIGQSHPVYSWSFVYDANGQLIQDGEGHTLDYDTHGRLKEVKNGKQGVSMYYYDALNILMGQEGDDGLSELMYENGVLVGEVSDQDSRCYLRVGDSCLAEENQTDRAVYWLGQDSPGSVLTATNTTSKASYETTYTAYGNRDNVDFPSHLGFNGERLDPILGVYHLGQGYRVYNPRLGFFYAPDSLSPFGAGGINPYAYCSGDPVNYSDPTGHFEINDIWKWTPVGLVVNALGYEPSDRDFVTVTAATLASLPLGIVAGATAGAAAGTAAGLAYDAITGKEVTVEGVLEEFATDGVLGLALGGVGKGIGKGLRALSKGTKKLLEGAEKIRHAGGKKIAWSAAGKGKGAVEGAAGGAVEGAVGGAVEGAAGGAVGGGPRWTLRTNNKPNYVRQLHKAEQGKYNEFCRLIAEEGLHPTRAATALGGSNFKKLGGNQFSIRLSKGNRVTFRLEDNEVVIQEVGGHTLSLAPDATTAGQQRYIF